MKSIRLVLLIVLVIALLVVFTGCSKAVATVNGGVINEKEINRYMDFFRKQDTTGALDEDEDQILQMETNILDSLIVVKLIEQYAAENGIEADQNEINEQMQEIIDTYPSEKDFENELKNMGIDRDFMSLELKNQVLRAEIYDLVTENVQVSEQQAEEFYEEQKDSLFMVPEKVKVSHILSQYEVEEGSTEYTEQAKDAAREKIENALEEIEKGEPFKEVAARFSDDQASAENGGDLGYITKGEMFEEFENEAFSLKEGEVSGIIETFYGFHILTVTDRQEEYVKEFEEVRETAIAFLENEEKNKAWEDFIYSLIDKAKIEYHTGLTGSLISGEEQ